MNASALKFDTLRSESRGRSLGHWQVFGHFATVEAALDAAARLAGKVKQLRVQMIDGVTLIGRS